MIISLLDILITFTKTKVDKKTQSDFFDFSSKFEIHFSYGMIGSSGCGKTTLLSCILGMDHLESGSIKVLGHHNVENKRLKASRRIGYMPQETALLDEFTVKETVYFFGHIFEMDTKKINERYKMLCTLLELPPDDLFVAQCSGGEKRRVSFAAAIIHEPDLLILDEPTVGLDPLLREKLWGFLWNITRTTKLSVIITTHYIDEAQKSDTVGLMRSGVLMTEGSPKSIMAQTGAGRLEDAFLEFCNKPKTILKLQDVIETSSTADYEIRKNETVSDEETEKNRSFFRRQIISILLYKYIIQFLRQPA